jgi:hypothetical protein
MSRAAHLMALRPRHRRTFFWRADFRGPAAPDGPPPCQRPCGYQCMHACIVCKSCRLQICEELVAICSRQPTGVVVPHWHCWAVRRPSPTLCRPPQPAAHWSAAACSPWDPRHLQCQRPMSLKIEGKHGTAADEKQVVRTGGHFSGDDHLKCIPNAADVAADHTLRLAGRRDVPWLLLSPALPGDLSHQCHFQSPLPQRSRKNCCTCRQRLHAASMHAHAASCCHIPQFGTKANAV